jgi:hypothetical protein
VDNEDNPLWHSIESWSQEKADVWLARTDGRCKFNVQEMVAKGNQPNLANQAGIYRNTNNAHLVWIMACVKVWAWAEATQVNSQQRLLELEQAWRRGALDDTLKFHVMSKRPDFKAIDISWVPAHQEGNDTGALGSVDPVGQQQKQ